MLYDGACGTGGMLTVAEETLRELTEAHGKQVATHLYGQEINAETYAICKADLLLKGEGDAADNIVGGPGAFTLANDAFRPVNLISCSAIHPTVKAGKVTRNAWAAKRASKILALLSTMQMTRNIRCSPSSDGQMLFWPICWKQDEAEYQTAAALRGFTAAPPLFTGDAGQESNIRRWIIENDWLEAIVALPLNMFYNTGIATYIWVLTNKKPAHRKRQVRLIDASAWYQPLRRIWARRTASCPKRTFSVSATPSHSL
ncbi:MAG: N-6 DNA methylase [Caldilineaceae bacterium]